MSHGPKLSPVRVHDHPGAVAKVSGSEDDTDDSGGEEQPSTSSQAAMRRASTRNVRKTSAIETVKNSSETVEASAKKMYLYGFFSRPVNPVQDECPDYFDVVSKEEAMDLGTMETMIHDGSVNNLEQFEACIDRIIACSRKYNEAEDNFVRIQTEKFAEKVKPILKVHRELIASSNEDEDRKKPAISTVRKKRVSLGEVTHFGDNETFDDDNDNDNDDESQDETEKRSHHMSLLHELLEDIVKLDLNNIFTKPVDPVEDECEDYFDIIDPNEAMDLGTIKTMISDGRIENLIDFEACTTRIFKCAYTYHSDKKSYVHKQAAKLESKIEQFFERYRRKFSLSNTKADDDIKQKSRKRRRNSNSESEGDTKNQASTSPISQEALDKALKTAAKQGAELNAIQGMLMELLRKIRGTCDPFSIFSQPVDPIEDDCEDYFEVIKHEDAMDLGTMETMIRNGSIATLDDFEACINRIIACSRTYNEDEDNFVRIETEKFAKSVAPILGRSRNKFNSYFARSSASPASRRNVDDDDEESYNDDDDDEASSNSSSDFDDDDMMPKKRRRSSRSSRRHVIPARQKRSKRISTDRRVSYKEDYNNDEDDAEAPGTPWSKKLPCKARNLVQSHNAKSAYFEVNNDTPHGATLHCSFSGCTARFVFCAFCRTAVSKNNLRFHSHSAQVNDSRFRTPENRGGSRPVDVNGISYRHQYKYTPRDAEIPGASTPAAKKDLSSSVITALNNREQWLQLVPEMLIVCNEAARRAKLIENPTATRYDKPLSETYIQERIEYDNDFEGYMVRTNNEEDSLQGFIASCNFMTFRETIRWDSQAPQAGITPKERRIHKVDDGSLAASLQSMKKTGSVDDGIILDRVAEISLLGGLGCGGILLRKILDNLDKSGKYDFVVLQATKMAITFYERHGFVRVGAVARFEDNLESPEVSYRHWGDIVEGRAVEASYMMALRLPSATSESLVVCAGVTNAPETIPDVNDTPRTAQKKFSALRKLEADESLKNARDFALEALELVTETTIGRSSYIELLSLSRDSAKSSFGQGKLAKEIQKAIQVFKKEDSDKISKDLLRKAFGIKHKIVRAKVVAVNADIVDRILVARVPTEKSPEEKLEMEQEEKPRIEREMSVRLKLPGQGQHFAPISASVSSSKLSPDNSGVRESAAVVFYHFCTSIINGDDDALEVGDVLMVPKLLRSGEPNWIPAEITGKCKRSEVLPEGGNSKNSFICTRDDGKAVVMVLDPQSDDRGIGRKWCMMKDWSAFSNLPLEVLDTLLLGASLTFKAPTGKLNEGTIVGRVGSGLGAAPEWAVESYPVNAKNKPKSAMLLSKFKTADLRDFIEISDDAVHRVKSMVNQLISMPLLPAHGDNDDLCAESEPTWQIPPLYPILEGMKGSVSVCDGVDINEAIASQQQNIKKEYDVADEPTSAIDDGVSNDEVQAKKVSPRKTKKRRRTLSADLEESEKALKSPKKARARNGKKKKARR
eukprot:CAMPEP_0116048702 /NCGR_PEP_ID=MMETSP0321-20121206/29741_1 /TAXON_ID=163516 /ORGANISM="Leptocylindrus danicus var. danicus, Strain B650" /LENGTH=1480 /DNA_ID=CAMNT_0003531017 /DNA_START=209 /DNA_END=4652 /DNA_ORIENTATION=-